MGEIGDRTRRQVVQHAHPIRVAEESLGEMRADEAGPTGDERVGVHTDGFFPFR